MKTMTLTLSLVAALLLPLADLQAAKPLTILFFTADDMNCDSSGVCGGPIKDLTPNLDRIQTDPTSDSSYGRVPRGKTRPVYTEIPPLMKSGLFGPARVITPKVAVTVPKPGAAAVNGPSVLSEDSLRKYVAAFNRNDHTHFGQAVANEAAADWLAANVPRFGCPDQETEEIYHYCDLIIPGLVGLRAQPGDTVVVNPLLPEDIRPGLDHGNASTHARP